MPIKNLPRGKKRVNKISEYTTIKAREVKDFTRIGKLILQTLVN